MMEEQFGKNRRVSKKASPEDDFFDSIEVGKEETDDLFEFDDFSGEGPDLDDFSGEGPDVEDLEEDFDEDFDEDLDFDENFDPVPKKGSVSPAYLSGMGSARRVRELNTSGMDVKKVKTEKEKKKRSTIKKIIGWSILEVITLVCIFTYGYFLRAWNLISRPDVDISSIENKNISLTKLQEMEDGYWTFAVFGVDGRDASDLVSKGLNSDVIMIVNISQATGEIRLCSVFRDTYLNISDSDSYRKINAAYCNGGPEQALAALNKNLDLNIKNYVTFNWKAVADGINILGGVDNIDISKAELYYINAFITETVQVTGIGSYQLKTTGPQHLDGVQAVAYGRLRLMDDDFARTERQKKIIKACFEKAKQSSFSVLNNIMVVCFPEVATNIDFETVVAMAQDITKYNIGATGGFPWQRSASAISSVGDVVVPATLTSNVTRLHEFLFDDANYECSSAVERYSAVISEKTGIYKEGQVVESVRTDGGLISQPKTKATEAEKEGESTTEQESETDENGNVIEPATIGLDENGNYILPTRADGFEYIPVDRNGNPIYPTDENGDIIYETDPSGNVIRPTDANGNPWTMPETSESETAEGESAPGETSHGDDLSNYNGPGDVPTKASSDNNAPGQKTTKSTTEAYGPGSPQQSTESTKGSTSHPTETSGNTHPGGATAPGQATGPQNETTSASPIAPGSLNGPGGEDGPGSNAGSTTNTNGPGLSTGGLTPGSAPQF